MTCIASQVKWQLMVTSCYRRLGDLYKALELYQKVQLQIRIIDMLLLSFNLSFKTPATDSHSYSFL